MHVTKSINICFITHKNITFSCFYGGFYLLLQKTDKQMKRFFIILISFALTLNVDAKVKLPQLFQSGMVVQRNQPIPVWGTADPNEEIVVKWQKRQYATVADATGQWRIDLPKTKAGGPYVMQIGDIQLSDVLVGDVWLCSGQSNIDVTDRKSVV